MEYRGHGHHHHHRPTKDALEFRSIDGPQNNLTESDLNFAGTDFARVGAANLVDGLLKPAQKKR
jgi:hypothetical protein